MAGFFPSRKDGACCGCDKQESACDNCGEDCAEEVTVKLETRPSAAYASRCGLDHPFAKSFPARLFRRVNVEFSIRLAVSDALLQGQPGEVAAYYDSRCDLSASAFWCLSSDADTTWSGQRRTNFWAGRPVVSGSEISTQSGAASGIISFPWFVDDYQDCWSANQMLGYATPGQPSRYSGGVPIGGILTNGYKGKEIASFVIPPPLLVSSAGGSEVWQFTGDASNGSFSFDFEGQGELFSGTAVRMKRTAKGSCSVTLAEEYTPEILRSEVIGALVRGAWGDSPSDAVSGFTSDLKLTYTYRSIEFRFRYDQKKHPKVRIGYRFATPGTIGPIQYVDSPGDRVFTMLPTDDAPARYVQLVSATVCQ